MKYSDQYGAFVAARLFGGLFGGTAPALGADTIVDLFFLHQRGKAFTVLNLSFLAGVVVGPTLSGFIVGSTSWTVQFWWSNGLEGIIIILTILLLEDTYYDRTIEAEAYRNRWPEPFFANRMATFFCKGRVIPSISNADTVSRSLPHLFLCVPEKNLPQKQSRGDPQYYSAIVQRLTGASSYKFSATPSSLASALLRFSAAA